MTINSADNKPTSIPTNTSEGLCTCKYILENEISTAKISAKYLYFAFFNSNTPAAAKDDAVCPDGNEYDFGISTKNL